MIRILIFALQAAAPAPAPASAGAQMPPPAACVAYPGPGGGWMCHDRTAETERFCALAHCVIHVLRPKGAPDPAAAAIAARQPRYNRPQQARP